MQLAESTVISIPTPHHEQRFVILPDELKRMRSLKLINDRCYVYLALRMSYDQSNPSVDVPTFAERWELSEPDVRAAIAALHKKGCLEPVHKQLELELFTTSEALVNIEAAKLQAKQQEIES